MLEGALDLDLLIFLDGGGRVEVAGDFIGVETPAGSARWEAEMTSLRLYLRMASLRLLISCL